MINPENAITPRGWSPLEMDTGVVVNACTELTSRVAWSSLDQAIWRQSKGLSSGGSMVRMALSGLGSFGEGSVCWMSINYTFLLDS